MHAGSVFFDKAGMNFNHIPVAHKLWAIILGSMLTLLGLGSGLFYFLEQAGQDVATAIQVNEDRISTALRWKALSQLNVERAYVLSVSTDDELILHTQKLVEVSSGNVVALQKQLEAEATSAQDQQLLARMAQQRKQMRVFSLKAQEAGKLVAWKGRCKSLSSSSSQWRRNTLRRKTLLCSCKKASATKLSRVATASAP